MPSRSNIASKSQLASPSALPVALTSFVGREREIAQLKQLLAAARLLTITGAGGSGKTRLALRVASDLRAAGALQDGVAWVELASLTNPDLVSRTVMNALAVREIPHESPAETLTNYLRTHDLLLVLDNCEHVISAAAQLCEQLLSACPQLKILTTSREALAIGAEQVWLVPPLALPSSEQPSAVQTLVEFEAVRLFVERARAVKPAFSLTPENAPAVLQICQNLDGIPLAIELAAARVTVLSVAQIAARLMDRLNLLTTGSRTALPRHQTLRAAIDWSYDLLSPAEKIVFCRLSVFVGGCTLEAAESVCVGGEIHAPQVLDLLSRLIGKSMVNLQAEGDATRYSFLETIRVYAQDRLEASGKARQVQERHLDFFLKFAKETYRWGFGTWGAVSPLNADDVREHYAAELYNVRAALAWSLDEHKPEQGLELAAALLWFWDMNSYHDEGNLWLRRALAGASDAAPQVRAYALLGICVLNTFRGNYDEAIAFGQESVALYRELEDRQYLADALGVLARAWGDRGNQARSIAAIEESLPLFRELGNGAGLTDCLNALAMARQRQGDYEGSVPILEEGLLLARKIQDEQLITTVLGLLARVYRMRGDFVQATLTYKQVMACSWKTGHTFRLAFGLEFYAVLATQQNQPTRAARLWGAAHALREATGLPRPASQTDYAEYERNARTQLDSQSYARLYAEGEAMPLEQAVEYAMAAPIPGLAPIRNQSLLPDEVEKQEWSLMTARERQIVKLVAQGRSNREIAAELVVSERTVEKHVSNILSKLNFQSRMQIAAWVLDRS